MFLNEISRSGGKPLRSLRAEGGRNRLPAQAAGDQISEMLRHVAPHIF